MQGQTQGNPLEQPGIQPPQESQPKQRGQNQPQLQPQQPAEDTGYALFKIFFFSYTNTFLAVCESHLF